MEISIRELIDNIDQYPVSDLKDAQHLLELIRENCPVVYDDLVFSCVLVDMTRFPVVLVDKTRTSNFPGFKDEYYDALGVNLQYITESSFIYHLMEERNIIVVDDYDELRESEIGDPVEKNFITESGMKSSIFHTLFYEEVEFGYLAIYRLVENLSDTEIEDIIDYLSKVLPFFSQKLLPAAYTWKTNIYRQEHLELESNLSDLILSITSTGEVVRINSLSSFYLGKTPQQILGKNLKDISPKLYRGIQESMKSESSKVLPISVTLEASTGQKVTLELNTWETDVVTDKTIVCYATDISLLEIFQKKLDE